MEFKWIAEAKNGPDLSFEHISFAFDYSQFDISAAACGSGVRQVHSQ